MRMKKAKLDKVRSIMFFNKEDFKLLKFQHLPLNKYKEFIESCNRRHAKECVVESRSGWEMPLNLGLLRVNKNFNIKGCKNTVTGEVYSNYHTLGFVYKCRLFREGRRVTLSPKYRIIKGEKSREVPVLYYKWNNHRANIDRYMASLLKENKIDYDEI